MRADRLLAMLMLLQARGRVTAGALAAELEVSERTIYRDVDALSAAGVPVYGDSGPGGGFALLDEYRTRLTGLTDAEARALLMLSIPGPLEALGVDEDLRNAMRKLAASMPASRRADEARVRHRYLLDPRPWRGAARGAPPRVPHLQVLNEAVWNDHRVGLALRTRWSADIELEAEPYALVAKEGSWHAVLRADGRWRAVRVRDVSRVDDAGATFARDPSFDLHAFWDEWCEYLGRFQQQYRVTVLAEPSALPEIRRRFGARAAARSTEESALAGLIRGRLPIDLSFDSLEAARDQLLPLGRGVEVVEPQALRLSLADYARQIVERYADETG